MSVKQINYSMCMGAHTLGLGGALAPSPCPLCFESPGNISVGAHDYAAVILFHCQIVSVRENQTVGKCCLYCYSARTYVNMMNLYRYETV